MDHRKQAYRLFRVYRAARVVGRAKGEYEKAKNVFSDRDRQLDAMLDSSDMVNRILKNKVHGEDVKMIGRAGVKSIPHVYEFIKNHVRKRR